MKSLLVLAVVVAGAYFGVRALLDSQAKGAVNTRVNAVFEGMKTNRVDATMETAIRAWAAEAIINDRLVSGFDRWRAEKGLYRIVKSAEITGVEKVQGSEGRYVVSVLIEGKPYRMHVEPLAPISWAK